MNCRDDADFIARAIALASDPATLAALRQQLATARAHSSLFDMAGFAGDFAAACRQLARG